MDSNYQLTVFRRDAYVTRRMDNGQVCYHVTCESKDPLELGEETAEECGLQWAELLKKPAYERFGKMYTKVEWQPIGKNWLVEQELNGHVFNTSEEPITNHFSTPYRLSPRQNYGRGLVELNRGDLSSFDYLCETTLDFATAASKINPILDPSSRLQETDLNKPTGTTLRDRVVNGVAQNIAMFQSQKLNDFQIVHLAKEQIRADLGKAFLIESESVRDSERTTAFEVEQVTIQELQGALGGDFASIERMQLPMFLRTKYQLEKERKIVTLPKLQQKQVNVRVLSGIEALSRLARAGRLVSFAQVVQALGPEALAAVNFDVLLGVLARYQGVYEPGVIKTPEQRQADQQRAIALQTQQAAEQKAVDVAGNVVESRASQNGTTAGA
jgi:hypothetical protein